jgi:hypothetical protein
MPNAIDLGITPGADVLLNDKGWKANSDIVSIRGHLEAFRSGVSKTDFADFVSRAR